MADSRLDEVCDAVAARIAANWSTTAPDVVEATDRPDFVTDPDDPEYMGAGRRVLVFAGGRDGQGPVSRYEDANHYRVTVLVGELYLGAGRPPQAWVRERREWVERVAFLPLDNARGERLAPTPGVPDSGLYAVEAAIEVATDYEELTARGLFFSVLQFTFRESVTVGG